VALCIRHSERSEESLSTNGRQGTRIPSCTPSSPMSKRQLYRKGKVNPPLRKKKRNRNKDHADQQYTSSTRTPADDQSNQPKQSPKGQDGVTYDRTKRKMLVRIRDFLDDITIQLLALLVAFFLLVATWYQAVLTRRSLDETRREFSTSQRAYVSLGDESGKLAEFHDITNSDKPIVILHFFNSGGSLARHFNAVLYASSVSLGNVGIDRPQPSLSHRHRFRIPPSEAFGRGAIVTTEGTIVTDVMGQTQNLEAARNQFGWMAKQPKGGRIETADVPPKALTLEYLTDNQWLVSRTTLADPNEDYTVQGDVEYCDIFGGYHCEKFTARYFPPPTNDFVQSTKPACMIENLQPTDVNLPKGTVEIAPCEQPDEQEYVELKAIQ
jgi:hypothetical protein